MCFCGEGETFASPSWHIVSMSLAGVFLGGLLASKKGLRFARWG